MTTISSAPRLQDIQSIARRQLADVAEQIHARLQARAANPARQWSNADELLYRQRGVMAARFEEAGILSTHEIADAMSMNPKYTYRVIQKGRRTLLEQQDGEQYQITSSRTGATIAQSTSRAQAVLWLITVADLTQGEASLALDVAGNIPVRADQITITRRP